MVVSWTGKAVPSLANNNGVGVGVGVKVGVMVGVWVAVDVNVGVLVGVELGSGVIVAVADWLGGASVGVGPQAEAIKINTIDPRMI